MQLLDLPLRATDMLLPDHGRTKAPDGYVADKTERVIRRASWPFQVLATARALPAICSLDVSVSKPSSSFVS